MDQIPALGTELHYSISKSFGIFEPLLLKNTTQIHSTKRTTHTYGPHPRHQLDIYYPSAAESKGILFWIHGGGFVFGSKILPNVPEELVHRNVGYFFAEHYNLHVCVIDYRLMQHGARFPSGGEDVLLAVEWTKKHMDDTLQEEAKDLPIYILGNSAGGVHVSTAAFAPQLEKMREAMQFKVAGLMFLGTPFCYDKALKEREEVLETYFGGSEGIKTNSPLAMLKQFDVKGSRYAKTKTRFLLMDGEFDPDDEIREPHAKFVDELQKSAKDVEVCVHVLQGHNHVSPLLGLGTGLQDAEAWGHLAGQWINNSLIS